jgi:low affinity Fe/Cu permease
MKNVFRVVAGRVSTWAGSAGVFLGAILIVLIWASSGPFFHYSDTWQLVINTGTTIITFLMVFLIQNTQNRDGKAVQIKLDELIRATKGARQYYVGLEDLTDDELAALDQQFKDLAAHPSTTRAIKRLQETIALAHAERKAQLPHLPHLAPPHVEKPVEHPAQSEHPHL